jgi:hypothetical protein
MAAVVYLVANLGAFLHTTMERHVVCAEHGHLVHADHAEEELDHVDEPSHHASFNALADHEAHHDHCVTPYVLKIAAQWTASEPPAKIPVYTVAPILDVAKAHTPIRGPTVRLLLLAPKTSPPVLA